MKKLTLFLVMILCLSLVGCGITTPKVSDNKLEKIENVVNEYFDYANLLDWDNALSCCLVDSVAYLDTLAMQAEIESVFGSFSWDWIIDITDVSVKGKFAEVYFDFTVTVTIGGDEPRVIGWEDAILRLEKVKGKWKIYDSENLDYFLPDN